MSLKKIASSESDRVNRRAYADSVFIGNNCSPGCKGYRNQSQISIIRIQTEIESKKKLPITHIEEDQFNDQITVSSTIAWCILFYSVLNGAIVPCWLMGDLKIESFTRNSWRYFMLTLLSIPFVLYEQRNNKQQKKKFYNLLTSQNLKSAFMVSLNYVMWVLFYVMSAKFTSMNHAVHLTNLMTFFLSLIRQYYKKKNHQFERGGYVLICFGMGILFWDSLTLPRNLNAPINQRYLRIHPLIRLVCGDFLAIFASFLLAFLSYYTPQPDMPRFSAFFLTNSCLTVQLITFSYFFGGSQFSFNPKYGLYGLFTIDNFVKVFYVSIILGIGLMISNIFVRQIFSETTIAVSSTFEPLLTSALYHILDQEPIPKGLTCLSYGFLIPGLLMIICGQGIIKDQANTINYNLYRPKILSIQEKLK